MRYGKEFVVRELIQNKYEVLLVEKITGKLIEKHGEFSNEPEAEMHADMLQGWSDHNGQDRFRG